MSATLRTVIAAALFVAAPSLARAQVVTFGADLNRPVNYRFDCGVGPGVGAFGEQVLYPTNVSSCTWIATGRNGGQAENMLVPNGLGTITNIRVKVGQITGPMQVVVLRAIRYNEVVGTPPGGAGVNVVCCAEVGRSAPFTPAANAISNVAVNLPVKADIVPNPITNAFDFDILALSVLQRGVPIPAHDVGNYQDIAGPGALIYFPAMQPGEERANPFGTGGYQLLMQADWVPRQVGGGGGGGTTPAAVTLVQPVATVQQNFLLLGLQCNEANPCVGLLRVQNQGPAAPGAVGLAAAAAQGIGGRGRAVKAARPVTFAKVKFEIPAGQNLQVRAKLSRKGKKMVRKSERPALFANLKVGSQESTAGAITIAP